MYATLFFSLLVLAGFALMIVGADRLIQGAIDFSLRLNLSKAFVGAVLVGFGTSAPELFTSMYSAMQGEGLLAAGNVIGSNVFNSTLAMGACLLFPFALQKQERGWLSWSMLLLPGALILWALYDLKIESYEGLTLFAPLPVLFFFLFKQHDTEEDVTAPTGSVWLSGFWVVLGLLALSYGAKLATESCLKLVDLLGISKGFAGTIILAAGTGLPELVTTIMAGVRKELSLAFANIIGSNTLNALGVLGAAGFLFPFSVTEQMGHSNAQFLVLLSVFLVPLLTIKNRQIHKIWAVLLFGCYIYFSLQN